MTLFDHVRGRPIEAGADTAWCDGPSPERSGWRERSATVRGEPIFAVDYVRCAYFRLGLVEQPFTSPTYQRRGLARVGLAALRDEQPGLAWHTLGGHMSDSRGFWLAIAGEAAGGYQRRSVCKHLDIRVPVVENL
ncbi:hypothetical protein GCM10017567_44710 [Amycolatopsis bullii]|uniref:GNAT family N-acetyltransferase n=1 Tax=Amycolatopsis bullii TaxID=941987 RepID=A0ABQ3KFR7_9PSEU|nr:hypothetical protein GCM10017567_44710 [Amycolatopsis bullii]